MQTADWVQNAEWEFILFSRSSTFRGIHTLICAYVAYIAIGLHEGPPYKHTHTHTNKKDTACLMTSAHPTSSPHNLFSNSHHDECTSFLNTQLRKNKNKIYSKSLESSHKPNLTVPIFSKSKKSMQINELAPRALWFGVVCFFLQPYIFSIYKWVNLRSNILQADHLRRSLPR